MKKAILTVLAMLTVLSLASCGEVEPPMALSASPEVSAYPEPSAISAPVEKWTGIWEAVTTGSTIAQVHIFNETADRFEFSVMFFDFIGFGDSVEVIDSGFRATATKQDANTAVFVGGEWDNVPQFGGTLVNDGSTLLISLDEPDNNDLMSLLPTAYTLCDDAETAVARLPFSSMEDGMYATFKDLTFVQAVELFGELVDIEDKLLHESVDEVYRFVEFEQASVCFFYPSADSDDHSLIWISIRCDGFEFYRDIKLGDTFDDVLSKYPRDLPAVDYWSDYYEMLYGKFWIHGYIETDEKTGEKRINYSDEWMTIRYSFNTDNILYEVYCGNMMPYG